MPNFLDKSLVSFLIKQAMYIHGFNNLHQLASFDLLSPFNLSGMITPAKDDPSEGVHKFLLCFLVEERRSSGHEAYNI